MKDDANHYMKDDADHNMKDDAIIRNVSKYTTLLLWFIFTPVRPFCFHIFSGSGFSLNSIWKNRIISKAKAGLSLYIHHLFIHINFCSDFWNANKYNIFFALNYVWKTSRICISDFSQLFSRISQKTFVNYAPITQCINLWFLRVRLYQKLQKICRKKECGIKAFWASVGKFKAKYLGGDGSRVEWSPHNCNNVRSINVPLSKSP